MKKILLCIIFCIVCFSLLSQDRYIYNDDGEKIYFIENANTKYVKFENIIQNNIRKNINKLSVLTSEIDTISENFYKIKIGTRNISSFHNEIKKMDSVLYSNEFIYTGDSMVQCCFNKILLKIKDGYDIQKELYNNRISYTLPEGMTIATLVMTNTLGVNVKTVQLDGNNGKTTLSLEELPSGIYFYTIRCGENVKSGKLVKRN